jgi:hypothetical protein
VLAFSAGASSRKVDSGGSHKILDV